MSATETQSFSKSATSTGIGVAAKGKRGNDGDGSAKPHPSNHPADLGENLIPDDLPKPGTGMVIAVTAGAVVLLIAMFLIGWFPHHRREQQAQADAADRSSAAPLVGVAEPKPVVASKDIMLPCDIRAFQDTSIFPRANGYLKKLYVDIQDRVDEHQLLAEIDTPDVDAQLAQSKAALEQANTGVPKAQADLDLAKVTLNRYLDAQKGGKGSVTQEDVDTKQAAYDQAVAALNAAKANVAAAQANVDQLTALQGFEKVYAPFAGTITARNYDVGALLSPSNTGAGRELFQIAQTNTLKVYVNVPQTYSTSVTTGQTAYLTVRNYPAREFEGTVARSSSALNPNTRTLAFELHFPNKDGALYAGMYGTVRLPITTEKPVMTIPTSALVFNAAGLQVAIVKAGKVHYQKIEVGRDLGTEIEVTNGVAAGDRVISNPGERLVEGGMVQVADAKTPAPAPKPEAAARAAAAN